MIAITVTLQIKTLNELSNSVGSIMTRSDYPNKFWGELRVVGGYKNRTDLHQSDGWAIVVNPAIGENQVRGELYYKEDEGVFTYPVIDLTDAQIEANLIAESEANKEQQIQAKSLSDAEQSIIDSIDQDEQLENIDVYPFWAVGLEVLKDELYKHLDELVLRLYKAKRDLTTVEGDEPPNNNSKWKEIKK